MTEKKNEAALAAIPVIKALAQAFVKNKNTTIAGIALFIVALSPQAVAYFDGDEATKVDFGAIGMAAAALISGLLMAFNNKEVKAD